MSASFTPRTVAQAIEDAAASTRTGFRFLEENAENEPFFTHAGIERPLQRSARARGARRQAEIPVRAAEHQHAKLLPQRVELALGIDRDHRDPSAEELFTEHPHAEALAPP